MQALDTNLLVRLVTGDDPPQLAQVRALLDAAAGEPWYVAAVVACELVWTLGRHYRLDRRRLVAVLRGLVEAPWAFFPDPKAVKRALDAYAAGAGDFADYLIRERALAAGCDAVVTFDRALHGEPGFVAPA